MTIHQPAKEGMEQIAMHDTCRFFEGLFWGCVGGIILWAALGIVFMEVIE